MAARFAEVEAARARPLTATLLAEREPSASAELAEVLAAKQRDVQTAVQAAAGLHAEVDRLHREVAVRDAELAELRARVT